jgi:alkylation response protein AidB-like acyl-CoA dehydrogenase
MNFDLTTDQKMLVETAASFARKTSPVERMRRLRDDELGFERAVWRQMGELGWLGILFADDVGGFGGAFQDAALVLEQFGRMLVPEPYVEAVILGGLTLARLGSAEQRQRHLPSLVAGESLLALAWAEQHGRYDVAHVATRAEARAGGGWELSGEKIWVLAGHAADHLLVSARTAGAPSERDGVSLFVVDARADGVTRHRLTTMDGRKAARVELHRVRVAPDALVGRAGQAADTLDAIMDVAAAATCAEGVGVAQAVLDMTVDYLKTREQFGVKIGAFQVLQHRAVDMFVQAQLLRSMSLEASIRIDDADDLARKSAVSAAKVQLATGGSYVAKQGIQLHGGIGCTDEHDVGLYFKRMHVLGALFGDEAHHLARYASLPDLAGVPD